MKRRYQRIATRITSGGNRNPANADVKIPMLFLQGTRDSLAELALLEPVVKGIGRRATLHLAEGADHSFHVLKSSGRNDREVLAEILDAFAVWTDTLKG